MTLLGANALSDAIGKLIYNVLYGWISGWSDSWGIVGAFSVTVIMFTLFLKIILTPFDFWQKQLSRSNAKKMELMKPQLDKITKQCGSNKQLLMQKQRALYKQYKYSTFGACLPLIITMVIFFIILGGFNSAVRMHNLATYEKMKGIYETVYDEAIESLVDSEMTDAEKAEKRAEAVAKAEQAVLDSYESEKFFLTKNIFVADNWKDPIPSSSDFTGTGMGGSGIDVDAGRYEIVMRPLMEKYNDQWNGYLILPVLVLLLNLVTMKLNKPPEQPAVAGQSEEQRKAQQTQMKVMQFIMPIIMLVFAIFYSAAFTLYMLISSLYSTIFNLCFNLITKRIDAREKDRLMSTTVKK